MSLERMEAHVQLRYAPLGSKKKTLEIDSLVVML